MLKEIIELHGVPVNDRQVVDGLHQAVIALLAEYPLIHGSALRQVRQFLQKVHHAPLLLPLTVKIQSAVPGKNNDVIPPDLTVQRRNFVHIFGNLKKRLGNRILGQVVVPQNGHGDTEHGPTVGLINLFK